MVIDKICMKHFWLLILCFLCSIDSLAQGQIVRRKTVTKAKPVVSKKNVTRRNKKTTIDKTYPYVRSYGSGVFTRETSHHFWWLTSISLFSDYTVLSNVVMPKAPDTYVCSTSDQYLLDLDSGRKYYIKRSEIGIGKTNCRYFYDSKYKSFPFKEYYEPLPISTERIRIYNGDRFSDVILL